MDGHYSNHDVDCGGWGSIVRTDVAHWLNGRRPTHVLT